METSFNQETGVKTWEVTKWYEKTYYVIGVILTWFYLACAIIGLTAGIMNEI